MIPSKSNSKKPWPVDWVTYKERHLAECFFQQIKWFRRVPTRYNKLDSSFLGQCRTILVRKFALRRLRRQKFCQRQQKLE